jgi:hypothetical protein
MFSPTIAGLESGDVQGGLSMIRLYEYFQLWDALQDIQLSEGEDCHTWWFDSSGQFSNKSAYKAFFHGSITFEHWKRLWKTRAPAKFKLFLWLAIRNRC